MQTGFATNARSSLGSALRRLPVSGEVVFRSLVMTAALVIVGVSLQFLLYAEPLRLRWLTISWFTATLPRIVAIGFVTSLTIVAITEIGRLIGGPMLTSIVLGTYHRPTRQHLIVMFLDIAGSTRPAEEMGELRVHDLITRFFFDIDEPIRDYGGAVHAYVGDEVIATWPVTGDPGATRAAWRAFLPSNERWLALLSTISVSSTSFRASVLDRIPAVIVSECGDVKRQLAYFGDTMNVAARLCEYCKEIDQRLVVSGNLLPQMTIPVGLRVGDCVSIALRGRQGRIESMRSSGPSASPRICSRLSERSSGGSSGH